MKYMKINPKWRTDTVVGICVQMRELQDFSAMPILADALQDADCDNETLLSDLRMGPTDYITDATLISLILTDEAIEAIQWIQQRAIDLGPKQYYDESRGESFDYLGIMREAHECVNSEWHCVNMGTNEDYKDMDWEPFWEKYALITGVPNPDKGSFFSCAC